MIKLYHNQKGGQEMLEYSDEMIVFETDCCASYKSYYDWDNEENEGDKDNDR